MTKHHSNLFPHDNADKLCATKRIKEQLFRIVYSGRRSKKEEFHRIFNGNFTAAEKAIQQQQQRTPAQTTEKTTISTRKPSRSFKYLS